MSSEFGRSLNIFNLTAAIFTAGAILDFLSDNLIGTGINLLVAMSAAFLSYSSNK